MGIETATGIWSLNVLWPLSSELGDDSDAHHRLTKSAVQATFPNVAAAVSASSTAINHMSSADELTQPKLDAYSASISSVVAELDALSAGAVSINAGVASQSAAITLLNASAGVDHAYYSLQTAGVALSMPAGWEATAYGVGTYGVLHGLGIGLDSAVHLVTIFGSSSVPKLIRASPATNHTNIYITGMNGTGVAAAFYYSMVMV